MNDFHSSSSLRPSATISVGSSAADVVGLSGRAIQIAIDAVAFAGGGTVHLAAGDYVLQDSVRLRPGVALIGAGPATVLLRGSLVSGRLAIDADISETQFTPVDPTPWRVGMGVCFSYAHARQPSASLPYTIVAIDQGTCHLNTNIASVTDFIAEDGGVAINKFPMVLIHQADGAVVENLTIDAAVADPDDALVGLRCDAVYVRHSTQVRLRKLVVRHAHSDGICFADSSVGMILEDCEVGHCGHYGIHPGSHSADCIVRRCHIHDCGYDGLYVCWGIRRGRFIDNTITHNGITALRSGICIGHKDTDCLIEGNRITGNRKHGIAFRRKSEANGAHRALVRGNIIEDNGSPASELAEIKAKIPAYEAVGCGIHVEGVTKDLVIENNVIRETRSGEARTQRHGIVLESGATVASLTGNTMAGHPESELVDRVKSSASHRG